MSASVKYKQGTASKDVQTYCGFVKEGMPGKHGYVVFLGLKSWDTGSFMKKLEAGLSYAALKRFRATIDLPMHELADLVQISVRTLSRRKASGRLQPDESDRLARLSRVFALVIELFEGNAAAARAWLFREQTALGGAVPIEFLKTDAGSREVEDLVGRLEHGVYS